MHPGKRSSGPRKRKPTCRINGARSPSKDCPRLSADRRMQSSSERSGSDAVHTWPETYTYSDLAAELRHSEGAIKRRILDLGINKKPVRCPPRKWTEDEVETLCRMVDEGYDFTLIAEKLNRTALATRGKYERLQNPEYNKRYNRGQNEDYEYQGIRSISGKDILKDRELMDGAEFQELEPVANK